MAKKNGANLGFENELWLSADKLRNNMDAAEYKHIVLGLLFLKYISDSFEDKYNELLESDDVDEEEIEDRDHYTAENIFWVPKPARWSFIRENAKKAEIGQIIDQAMIEIENENEDLKGILPKDYARESLDKRRLGELIDILSFKIGDKESKSKDVLGRVYEYFLGKFANAEGKNGGEFYTPSSVVRTLVEMIEPTRGRVYDPCCGSGGMFVQSERFVEAHAGKIDDISVYGQESNHTTWKLCKMNLAIRQIEGDLGDMHSDSFHNDLHNDLKADYILANPPFNISDWGGNRLADDVRWQGYGVPPAGNANYAWILHMLWHLAPGGKAGFVLANGSMSTSTSGEGEIRKNLIEKDNVDCIVTLPGQLFYTTQIPVCLWFVVKNKKMIRRKNKRNGEILFIDARKLGYMEDRTHKALTDDDVAKISNTYHNWENGDEKAYEDIKGFCKSAKLDEVKEHDYILTPGRYVGIEEVEDDGEPFEEKMDRLTSDLSDMFKKSKELEDEIRKNLSGIGFEV